MNDPMQDDTDARKSLGERIGALDDIQRAWSANISSVKIWLNSEGFKTSLMVGAIATAILEIALVSAIVSSLSTPPARRSVAVATATRAIPTLTPQSTQTPQTYERYFVDSSAILGSPLTLFEEQYGQPNDHTNPTSGQYTFERYPNSTIDRLFVYLNLGYSPPYNQRAFDVGVQPNVAPGDVPISWIPSQGLSVCLAFAPQDAVFVSKAPYMILHDEHGVEYVYRSALLAAAFPASAFVDAQQRPVPPGTFDILFYDHNLNDSSLFDGCDVEVGQQQQGPN